MSSSSPGSAFRSEQPQEGILRQESGSVKLYCNQISDINILENVNFTELKELNLSYNNISEIKVLEKVKFNKLEKLDLSGNKIGKYKYSNIINALIKRYGK